MAQILIRGLEESIKLLLQQRAARRGRSMEAEARDILGDALRAELQPAGGLGTRIAARVADAGLEPGEALERPVWGEPRDPFVV